MAELHDGRRFKRWVSPVVIGLILAGTLTPNFGPSEPLSGVCLICGYRGLADAIANVLLFLPLGMALRWRLTRPLVALTAAFLLSGAVEGLQFLIPGRHPALGDLVFNTLGAGLGVLAAGLLPNLLRPEAVARRRFGVLAASLPAALLLATAWLLQPSFPESVYYGQWTADLGHLDAYEGRILEATIGESAAPSRRLADSHAVRARLLGGAPVRVVFQPGPRPPGLAPIFSVFDEHQREIVLYGLDDRDLVLRYRTRAVAIRLDQPDLRVVDAAFDPSVSTVTWVAHLRDEGFCVWLDGRERACPVAHTAGRAWSFLVYPELVVRRFTDGIDFLWVLLLTLPIGFWGRRLRPTLTLAAPAVAASLLAPWIFGQVTFSIWVLAAALIGPLLGSLVARWLAGRAKPRPISSRIARHRTHSRSAARTSESP